MSLIDSASSLVSGGVTSIISKVFSSIGGHKAERFGTPEKIQMWITIQQNLIDPYLKEIFGIDYGDTNPEHIQAAKDAQYLINTGQIPSYNRSRPANEVGSAMNDAAKDVAQLTWVDSVFEQTWLFLCWDMWRSDSEDLIQAQRVQPLLKCVDAYVDILSQKYGVQFKNSPHSILTTQPVPVKSPNPVSNPVISVQTIPPSSMSQEKPIAPDQSQQSALIIVGVVILAIVGFFVVSK